MKTGSASTAPAIREVFDGFLTGEREATETVQGWVRSVVHGGNWRFDDPESIGQEVLLKLLNNVRAGKIRDAQSFQQFVYRVAKFTCVDVYHAQKRHPGTELPEEEIADPSPGAGDPQRRLEQRERLDLMVYIFQRLPAGCRELWNLVYHDRLTPQEVGRRLGISVNNVRVRVHRCLEKARALSR